MRAAIVWARLLLLYTPQRTFLTPLIPWLMLAATLLCLRLALKHHANCLSAQIHIGPVAVVVIQFFIAIYGGYFGGAIGIVMLATWTVFGLTDIHVMNANRTLMGAAANSVAALLFIVARKIWWPQTLVMLVAAILGGYIGARTARKVDPRYIRALVTVVSAGLTIAFFLRGH